MNAFVLFGMIHTWWHGVKGSQLRHVAVWLLTPAISKVRLFKNLFPHSFEKCCKGQLKKNIVATLTGHVLSLHDCLTTMTCDELFC